MVEAIEIPDATAQPAAYVAALLATLGEQDPVQVYARTPTGVRDLCAALDEDAWVVPLAPGEWSAHQVVGHLFDVDLVYGFRWRLTLTADHPTYPGYDENAWSRLPRPDPPALLAAFTSLREANLALLRALAPEQLRRRGRHGEQGDEDVARMLAKVAGHDLAHLNQLQRTVDAATRPPA